MSRLARCRNPRRAKVEPTNRLDCQPAEGGWVIGSGAIFNAELVTSAEAEAFAWRILGLVGVGGESPAHPRLSCKVVRPGADMGKDAVACVLVRGRCYVTDGEARTFAAELLEAAGVASSHKQPVPWQANKRSKVPA